MNNASVSHVIWDWNGTLLNDVDLCLWIIHQLGGPRGIAPPTLEDYLDEFTFPVIHYYEALGFDSSPAGFDTLANEWMDLYLSNLETRAALQEGAREVLTQLKAAGYRQSILSAYKHDMLLDAVNCFGVTDMFDDIRGLHNHYGESKMDLGRDLLNELHEEPESVLLIGDTLHDLEVANELGMHCALIANGHYSEDRLRESGATVLNSIKEVPDWIS